MFLENFSMFRQAFEWFTKHWKLSFGDHARLEKRAFPKLLHSARAVRGKETGISGGKLQVMLGRDDSTFEEWRLIQCLLIQWIIFSNIWATYWTEMIDFHWELSAESIMRFHRFVVTSLWFRKVVWILIELFLIRILSNFQFRFTGFSFLQLQSGEN